MSPTTPTDHDGEDPGAAASREFAAALDTFNARAATGADADTLTAALTHLGDAYDRLATTDTSTRDGEQLPARICVKDWQHVTRQLLSDDRDHRDIIRALTRVLRDAVTGDADERDLNAAVEAARAHAQ